MNNSYQAQIQEVTYAITGMMMLGFVMYMMKSMLKPMFAPGADVLKASTSSAPGSPEYRRGPAWVPEWEERRVGLPPSRRPRERGEYRGLESVELVGAEAAIEVARGRLQHAYTQLGKPGTTPEEVSTHIRTSEALLGRASEWRAWAGEAVGHVGLARKAVDTRRLMDARVHVKDALDVIVRAETEARVAREQAIRREIGEEEARRLMIARMLRGRERPEMPPEVFPE